jgi:hypothetical protein
MNKRETHIFVIDKGQYHTDLFNFSTLIKR